MKKNKLFLDEVALKRVHKKIASFSSIVIDYKSLLKQCETRLGALNYGGLHDSNENKTLVKLINIIVEAEVA